MVRPYLLKATREALDITPEEILEIVDSEDFTLYELESIENIYEVGDRLFVYAEDIAVWIYSLFDLYRFCLEDTLDEMAEYSCWLEKGIYDDQEHSPDTLREYADLLEKQPLLKELLDEVSSVICDFDAA